MTLDLGLSRKIVQEFDGGEVCTDGGLLILRKADDYLRLTENASYCIKETRLPSQVLHSTRRLFQQRVYSIAAGYEDCNDAGKLRGDAMHRLALGYEPDSETCLASQPSLSRFEARADADTNKALQSLLVHTYIRSQKKKPKVVRLAMDTTCDEVYGYQQMSFWNGYYETFCYAPLLIFTDDGFPLCALLRPGNPNPIDDALRMLKKIVHEIRLSWPGVSFELTADAAFNSSEIFEYCEANDITYFIAAASHAGLTYYSQDLVQKCRKEFEKSGIESPELKKYGMLKDPKERQRIWRQREERIRFSTKEQGRMQERFENDLHIRKYGECTYRAREWKKERRFICRVDYTEKGPDVRFVVTNSRLKSARKVYEEKYCRRARCENWIKDLKTYLKSDRTSCQEFDANQFRLLLHTFAYILIWETRKKARMPEMTVHTFQLQVLKIGVLIQARSRKIALHLASGFVWKEQFRQAWNAFT
ncbi:MAG: IS1380 family transposase [Leptolyngbya sp.]|nr:IS1380 family transposase [Candidatus Melainabacteria bacterium]